MIRCKPIKRTLIGGFLIFIQILALGSIYDTSVVQSSRFSTKTPLMAFDDPVYLVGNDSIDLFCAGNGTTGESWESAHRIENLTIDGFEGVGVFIANTTTHLILRNLTIFNCSTAISIQNCTNIRIQNCTLNDSISAIDLNLVESCIISNNTLYSNDYGIRATADLTFALIENNSIYLNQYGIYIWGVSSQIDINSNDFQENQYCIDIQTGCNSITISNNEFSLQEIAIRSLSSPTIINSILIENNTILDSTNTGIRLEGADYHIIHNNLINDSYNYGIRLNSGAQYNTIAQNNITFSSGPFSVGFYLNGASYNTISENLIQHFQTGIQLAGAITGFTSLNQILQNNISFNDDYGIYCASIFAGLNDIYRNILSDNGADQAYDSSGSNNWDYDNVGNYWGDYVSSYPLATNNGIFWNTPYAISGGGLTDNFPLVNANYIYNNPPTWANVPNDFVQMKEGSLVDSLVWTVSDDSVLTPTYEIEWNEMLIDSGAWISTFPIVIELDGLPNGWHIFDITVEDGYGDVLTDRVEVLVTEENFTMSSIHEFGDTDSGNEIARGLFGDGAGSLYTVGYTARDSGVFDDLFLRRYYENGTLIWNMAYAGSNYDRGFGVWANTTAIYTVGSTRSIGNGAEDVFLRRWSTIGSVEWTQTLGGTASDIGYGIWANSTDIFIVGTTSSTGAGSSDLYLSKWDTGGNLIWDMPWGTTSAEEGRGVWVNETDGTVYTVGTSADGGDNNIVLIKWDQTGTPEWSRSWGYTTSDLGNAIWGDGTNVYITGTTNHSAIFGNDIAVICYNATGDQLWNNTVGGSGSEEALSISGDNGFLFIGGSTTSRSGTIDSLLLKMDLSGAIVQRINFIDHGATDRIYGLWGNELELFSLETSTGGSTNGDYRLNLWNTNSTAPRNLAISAGVNALELTWVAPLNQNGGAPASYNIYRGEFSGGEVYLDSVGTTEYIDNTVEKGLSYYYRVSAVNFYGEGGLSNEVTGMIFVHLNESVDNFNLNFSTGGNANWFGQSDNFYYDDEAAQSGAIGNNQVSWLYTEINSPSRSLLSFYWSVSSEPDIGIGADQLTFSVNGTIFGTIDGDIPWIRVVVELDEGINHLYWNYSKNALNAQGSDCGFLDKIEWSPLFELLPGPNEGEVPFSTGVSDHYYYADMARGSIMNFGVMLNCPDISPRTNFYLLSEDLSVIIESIDQTIHNLDDYNIDTSQRYYFRFNNTCNSSFIYNYVFLYSTESVAPTIVVNSPFGQYYSSAPLMDVDFLDQYSLDSAYYRVDSYIPMGVDTTGWSPIFTNYPGNESTSNFYMDSALWAGLSQGFHTVYFKVWDDAPNVNDGLLNIWTLYKDSIAPNITINSANGNSFSSVPMIDVDFIDSNSLANAYYRFDTYLPTGTTTTGWTSIFLNLAGNSFTNNFLINDTVWNALSEGTHNLYFKVWDDLNNVNDGESPYLIIIKDTTAPTITALSGTDLKTTAPFTIEVNFFDAVSLSRAYIKFDSYTPGGTDTTGWIEIMGSAADNNETIVYTIEDSVYHGLSVETHKIYFKAWDIAQNVRVGATPMIEFTKIPIPTTPVLKTLTIDNKVVHLEWEASLYATEYYIFRSTSELNAAKLADLEPFATSIDTEYDDIVSLSGKYYYAVVAVNDYAKSAASNIEEIEVKVDEGVSTAIFVGVLAAAGALFAIALVAQKKAITKKFLTARDQKPAQVPGSNMQSIPDPRYSKYFGQPNNSGNPPGP